MTDWDVLTARTPGLARDAREFAEGFLSRVGVGASWGVDTAENLFRDETSLHNLWAAEMRRPMREWWERDGGGEAEYRRSIGTVQYRSVAFYSPALFHGAYQANKGWRILALGLPIFDRVVLAFASHYQGGQNHNKLGAASRFLGELILSALTDGKLANARLVTADDWDGPGLLEGVTAIGSTHLPPEAPAPHLKDARNTTLKKVIASCMTIEVVEPDDLDTRLVAYLDVGELLQA